MDYINLMLIFLLPFFLGSIFIFPQILLYYVVLDSWLIVRVTQMTVFHEALSFNRIVVFIGIILICLKRLGSRKKIMPSGIKTVLTAIVTIFIMYCSYSYFSYTGTLYWGMVNNLFFYFLALLLLDEDFDNTFRHICILVFIPIALLSITTIINVLVNMDIGQRSYAGNRNQTSFYILLGLPFLFVLREILKRPTKLKKIVINGGICAGFITISLSLGRLAIACMLVSLAFYVYRKYIKVKTAAIIVVFVVAIFIVNATAIDEYMRKLFRMPQTRHSQITQFNEDEMSAFTSGRSLAYKEAWKMFTKSPWVGIGFDRWYLMHKHLPGSSLHSRWLQILTETGIPGFVLYGVLFALSFMIIWRFRRRFKNIREKSLEADAVSLAMVIFLLAGVTDNHGFTDRIFYLFLAMIATIHVQRADGRIAQIIKSAPAFNGSAGQERPVSPTMAHTGINNRTNERT